MKLPLSVPLRRRLRTLAGDLAALIVLVAFALLAFRGLMELLASGDSR